jgi:hypothetical protein
MGAVPVKRYTNFTSLFAALLVLAYAGVTAFQLPAAAQQASNPPQYYPETGHTVRDPFINYFLSSGGIAQYGYPITDDYVDPATRMLVQYFQKARFEWHPGNPDPYKVQLGLLGTELGKGQAPIPISKIPQANGPSCEYFAETGHSLCFVFHDYWLSHGGLDRFGYPISEYGSENGLTTQYFQRGSLQWLPGKGMQVPPVGATLFNKAGFDPTRLDPVGAAGHLGQVTTLYAHASVFKSTAVVKTTQTAFVFVTDQFGRPVSGVAVTLIVYFPDGATTFTLLPTNAGGTTFQGFALTSGEPGKILPMKFVLSYPGLPDATTTTSCMVWY